MINHLCWSGVEEAQELLQPFASTRRRRTRPVEDNRPAASAGSVDDLPAPTDEPSASPPST